jgi:hypothetical protein
MGRCRQWFTETPVERADHEVFDNKVFLRDDSRSQIRQRRFPVLNILRIKTKARLIT